ncbi:growth/differentiation factor 8-like [Liolophura sinensis]|uniref:growth/differentiation factor 8-like n=1 Tax=Liolophura sinensis TaxID=3198878 RepID=UPI00315906D6
MSSMTCLEPFLAIRVIQDYRRRYRRDSSKTCDKDSTVCCDDTCSWTSNPSTGTLSWSPKKFVSYFCSGDCPLIYKQINQQTHILKNVNSSYEACCKPSSLGPLQMLYRKNASNFVIEYIPGMVTKHAPVCEEGCHVGRILEDAKLS